MVAAVLGAVTSCLPSVARQRLAGGPPADSLRAGGLRTWSVDLAAVRGWNRLPHPRFRLGVLVPPEQSTRVSGFRRTVLCHSSGARSPNSRCARGRAPSEALDGLLPCRLFRGCLSAPGVPRRAAASLRPPPLLSRHGFLPVDTSRPGLGVRSSVTSPYVMACSAATFRGAEGRDCVSFWGA